MSSFISTPSWQRAPGVPGLQGRYTPDMSFSAASHDGYARCFAASNATCISDSTGVFHFSASGGTSASAPSMAGVAALLNQKMGSPQGNLNPGLYALANSPAAARVFHDITIATSAVGTCDPATPSLCNNSTPGPNGLTQGLAGYLVGPGYDLATGLGSIDVTNFLANWTAGAAPALNYQGLWWNTPAGSESGWGINLAHQGDVIFATWFTYDATGNAWWLSMTANRIADNATRATCTRRMVPRSARCPSTRQVRRSVVGQATLAFTDDSSGTFTYTVNGTTDTKAITREVYGTLPRCAAAQGNVAAATNYQDLWWTDTESGWGLNITQQSDVIFATWFTYDANGDPLWLSGTARRTGGTYSGNALSHLGATLQFGSLHSGERRRDRGRVGDVHLRQRKQRDLRLHGERDLAVEADHARALQRNRNRLPVDRRRATSPAPGATATGSSPSRISAATPRTRRWSAPCTRPSSCAPMR